MNSAVKISILLATSTSVFSQQIPDTGFVFDGRNPEDQQSTVITNDPTAIEIPENAKTRYALGEAPFYVRLIAYAQHLSFAVRSGAEGIYNQEADLLGISTGRLEELAFDLNRFSGLKNDDWEQRLVGICQPYFAGRGISNEEARMELTGLDDNEARLNQMARSLVENSSNESGAVFLERLEARIMNFGMDIDYTKVNLVEAIEATENGDYQAHLIRSCESL